MNLYDLLDVDESATRDEIRAAWKSATADLDPTDRRFRAYNDAASVLLDDDKRAAYDAELAATRDADTPVEPAAQPDEHPDDEPDDEPDEQPDQQPDEQPDEAPPVAEPDETPAPDEQEAAGPPRWGFVAAVAAGVVALLVLVVVLALPGTLGGAPPSERADTAAGAPQSAEDAVTDLVPVVLAYDYRQLDSDIEQASSYLTDDFAAEREEFFAKPVLVDGEPLEVDGETVTFREQVVAEKLVVSAAVAGVGVTRVSTDGEVATVVAFIDQESQKGKAEPQRLRMWATLTLEREDDRWLLADICTEDDCY